MPFFLQYRGKFPCNTDAKEERHISPMKRNHNKTRCFECRRRQLLRYQTENIAYYTLKGGGKKNKLNDESITRLTDMMSKSKHKNKNFYWKKVVPGVFNLKRAHVNIKHISCVKNLWRRHNPAILTGSRKEKVKNILDGNKDSEINSRSEVVKRCESQRSAEHVITEPSVSDNVKRTEEETESVPETRTF